jgi:predicted aspartyl protease/Tfp pilus assembly protein PilF
MSQVLRFSLVFGLLSLYSLGQSSNSSATGSVSSSPPQVAADAGSPSSPSAAAASLTTPNPLGQALIFYRKGNFEGALEKYREILKDHPKSPDAYAGMVRVYLKQKNVDLAAQTADQGLALSDSPRIRVARAEVWFRQGKIAEAEAEWVKVINSGYPEARAYLGLARVRDAVAMYKTAKTMIEKAHQLDADDPDIQEEWVGTLARSERIQYLESSLAGDNNWDPDERTAIASYLQYLKERARQNKTSACRLVSKGTSTETALVRLLTDPQHLRGYGLSVSLNGHKSSLLLDTGASGILVKRSIAEHAGLSKITETKVWGIGDKGARTAYRTIADSIKIGDLEFQNCPVEVIEGRSVADEDGLIGADVFEHFLVDIDFPNEKLRLSQLPQRPSTAQQNLTLTSEDDDDSEDVDSAADKPADAKPADAKSTAAAPSSSGPQDPYIAPEMKSYTRVFRFGHDLLVPTTIGNVPYKLFILDTGALTNFISPAAAREVTKVHGDSDTILKGISGRVDKVYSANKAVLTFGHLRQENQDLTAFDTTKLSDDVGTEISGFLGFAMLRMLDIKIDYRDALIDFEYDAKRWDR